LIEITTINLSHLAVLLLGLLSYDSAALCIACLPNHVQEVCARSLSGGHGAPGNGRLFGLGSKGLAFRSGKPSLTLGFSQMVLRRLTHCLGVKPGVDANLGEGLDAVGVSLDALGLSFVGFGVVVQGQSYVLAKRLAFPFLFLDLGYAAFFRESRIIYLSLADSARVREHYFRHAGA
jgi:hypothetical protein